MSRYDDYNPRGQRERWDSGRFEHERGARQNQTIERDHYEERDSFSRRGGHRRESSVDNMYSSRRFGKDGQSERVEEDRYYERDEDRYGPPVGLEPRRRVEGERRERRIYEDEAEFDEERRFASNRRNGPPRPGMLIRRQSSLDTFDRKPANRYGPTRPRSPPEVISVPGPGRRRISPSRYAGREYDDIRIAEPDRYGDDSYRGWREREIETIRRRRRESSPGFREEDAFEEVIEEKPFPRRGRTKMSARLVNKRAIIDLGYPFEEDFGPEGDFVIILKALNKELIDEVLFRSKDYNERERGRVSYMIEAPPVSDERDIVERREIIIDRNKSDVPRSVREWDVMSGDIEEKDRHNRSERHSVHESRHGGHSDHGGSSHSTIKISKTEHERDHSTNELIIERKPSKSHRSHSHSRSRSHARIKSETVGEEEVGESNAMNTGPLALVLPHRSKSRRPSGNDRRLKEEIRELEIEKRKLKEERRHDRKHRRHRRRESSSSSSSSSSDGALIIERKDGRGGERDVKIEKDRRGNMALIR